MKTTAVTAADIAASVLAVPPLARHEDLSLDRGENEALIRHIEGGGVTTLLYGGNANLYHARPSEYAGLLQFLDDAAGSETLVIPSVGPAYGIMMDQAEVLRDFEFPTAMVLPQREMITPDGVLRGVRDFAQRIGRPVVLYIKHDGMISVDGAAQLFRDGLLAAIKYAVVREDPAHDDFLRELVDKVDSRFIISGIGEQPAIVHWRDFGLGGFTSGCVCVAPGLSMKMLAALRDGNVDEAERVLAIFRPLEDLRNAIHPVRVLHDAVTLSGIANMGTILPLLTGLGSAGRDAVQRTAGALLAAEQQVAV